ncbi:DUF3800 domain-containing protein [Pelagibius sp. 7325]|uniref:DUF3800 domain-containing protein n=1 Tax=Pelagibius sp. 7325 TaxID=3131994 RepID=UPI0030EDB16D
MRTFYVDESGFTGEDLLSAEQPVFAHATVDFDSDEAGKIVSSLFADINAKELKYGRLRRSPRYREKIIELVTIVARDPRRAASWVAHKEFSLMTLVVDWWIEPLAYRNGFNLYKDGANLAMANMMFYCLAGFWTPSFRHRLLAHFQHMMRAKTPKAFKQCETFISKANARADPSRKEALRYLLPSFSLLGLDHVRGLPDRVLDIALPGLVFLGHVWRSRHDDLWQVVHDQSANMAKQKWLWDALTSPDLTAARFENPGGAQQFPMNVAGTRFANSEDECQLQICDVLAGATAAFLRNRVQHSDEQAYFNRLAEAGIEKLIVGGLWPSPEVSPDALGMRGWDGSKAIEWISEQVTARKSD